MDNVPGRIKLWCPHLRRNPNLYVIQIILKIMYSLETHDINIKQCVVVLSGDDNQKADILEQLNSK